MVLSIEDYFKEKKLKRKTNFKSIVEELVATLGSHATFLLFWPWI